MNSFIATANDFMMRVMLDGSSGGGSGKFDRKKFFQNASDYLQDLAKYIMLFAGIILIIVAAIQIAKGFASGGRGQVNWVMTIGCLLVGGILAFGGFKLMATVAKTGADTLAELGGAGGIEEMGNDYTFEPT